MPFTFAFQAMICCQNVGEHFFPFTKQFDVSVKRKLQNEQLFCHRGEIKMKENGKKNLFFVKMFQKLFRSRALYMLSALPLFFQQL